MESPRTPPEEGPPHPRPSVNIILIFVLNRHTIILICRKVCSPQQRAKHSFNSLVLKFHWPKFLAHNSLIVPVPSFISALKLSQTIKGVLVLNLHNMEIKSCVFKVTL